MALVSYSQAEVRIRGFRSPAEVKRAQGSSGWTPLQKAMVLEAGDALRTGYRGRIDFVMEDGSRVSLGEQSRLVIQAYQPQRIFGLEVGRLKAFVKRLKPGNKFEVKTPLASAAVRGTILEMGYNEDKKNGYLEVPEGEVELTQGEESIVVLQGDRVEFAEGRSLLGLSLETAREEAERASLRHEVGLNMSKDQVLMAAAEEIKSAEYQEGKVLTDVHGQRVRLEEYIIRRPQEVAEADRDKAFKLVVLNERDQRFDYFYYRGLFNMALPTDLSVALRDIRGKLGPEAPTYVLDSYEMGMSNTQDTLKDTGSGGHLVKVTYDGTTFGLTDATNPSNTRNISQDTATTDEGVTTHDVYDGVKDTHLTVEDAGFQASDYTPVVYDAAQDTYRTLQAGDIYWRPSFDSYTHALNGIAKQTYALNNGVTRLLDRTHDATFTYAGVTTPQSVLSEPSGAYLLHNRIRIYYGDGTQESYNTYIISNEGAIAPTSAFNGLTSGASYKNELLNWNYQQSVSATEFQGRTIDLVVEPKILIRSGLIP